MDFQIGYMEMEDERTVKKMEKIGAWVTEVEVQCSYYLTERTPSDLCRILDALHEASLTRFELSDLSYTRLLHEYEPQHYVKELSASITRLIRTQTCLEWFTVASFCVTLEQGLDILENLSLGSGKTLQYLNITDFFEGLDTEVHSEPAFHSLMSRFVQLRSVKMDHYCLDEEVLLGLAENCGGILQDLTLTYRSEEEEPSPFTVISTSTWKKVHRLCPKLLVDVVTHSIPWDTAHFLPQGLPLRVLWFDSDGQKDQITDLFQRLYYFTDSLEELYLDLSSQKNSTSEQMVNFVMECRNLKVLNFNGQLQGGQVATICEAQRDGRLKLERLILHVMDWGDYTLDRIWTEYGPVFESRDTKLDFLCWTVNRS